MPEQIVKCRVCGEPYVFFSHYAGDESACPECHAKARRQHAGYPRGCGPDCRPRQRAK